MKRKYVILFFSFLICFDLLFLVLSFEFSTVRAVLDVDQIDEGYLVVEGFSNSPLSIFTTGYIPNSRVTLLDKKGVPYWIYDNASDPLAFAHEGLFLNHSNTILIVDTDNDRLLEVAVENKSVVWKWDAREANWTKYNPEWINYSYIQNPTSIDWTHINHVNYIEKRNSLILSLRNFDMLIEIPHNESAYEKVIWHFGEPGNHSLLHHQHNPEILPNGNLLVSDSENNRIVKINYTTKEIVWTWNNNGNLRWPRDSDYISSGKYQGCYLITDSKNSRVIILDPNTEKIKLILSSHIMIPYEADHISGEDCFLVGNSFNTQITKFNNNGVIVFFSGIPIIGFLLILNCCVLIAFYSLKLFSSIKGGNSWKSNKNLSRIFYIVAFLICLFLYNILFSILFQVVIFPIMETGPLATPA
ncbi:MAG: hypothetical protein GF329_00425 [Candidatus Lokiarchaeota archaeon]|nr:hypothetical protein [Candidatus Lokiarchaeota archaeon]